MGTFLISTVCLPSLRGNVMWRVSEKLKEVRINWYLITFLPSLSPILSPILSGYQWFTWKSADLPSLQSWPRCPSALLCAISISLLFCSHMQNVNVGDGLKCCQGECFKFKVSVSMSFPCWWIWWPPGWLWRKWWQDHTTQCSSWCPILCRPIRCTRTHVVPDSMSRPADILLPTWHGGRPAALDVHIISPLRRSRARYRKLPLLLDTPYLWELNESSPPIYRHADQWEWPSSPWWPRLWAV